MEIPEPCAEDPAQICYRQVTWNAGAIPEAQRARLFEPYQRGKHASRSGIGLGLYITRKLVDAHGGRIDVRSSEDEGTTFTVALPRTEGTR